MTEETLTIRRSSRYRCVILLAVLCTAISQISWANVGSDDPAYEIRLSGVPGPYAFGPFCRLSSGEIWMVGGEGRVSFISATGNERSQEITDVSLNAINFVTCSIGWALGDEGKILYTSNKGMVWSEQFSGVNENLEAIDCLDLNQCWIAGAKGVVLKTSDQGRNWKRVWVQTAESLHAINFIDQQNGWIAGNAGTILHTSDGGESWKVQNAVITLFPDGPYSRPTNLMAVKFINKNIGWAAGNGGIALTRNGGKTWRAVNLDGDFIGLVTHDGQTVFAINAEGRNYRSINGGETWAPF